MPLEDRVAHTEAVGVGEREGKRLALPVREVVVLEEGQRETEGVRVNTGDLEWVSVRLGEVDTEVHLEGVRVTLGEELMLRDFMGDLDRMGVLLGVMVRVRVLTADRVIVKVGGKVGVGKGVLEVVV